MRFAERLPQVGGYEALVDLVQVFAKRDVAVDGAAHADIGVAQVVGEQPAVSRKERLIEVDLDGPANVPLDGPALDRAPLDTPKLDVAPEAVPPDLPLTVDLPSPDLPPPDLAPLPTSDWVIDNTTSIDGQAPTVMGTPTVTAMDAGRAVCFDGTADGLLFDTNPIPMKYMMKRLGLLADREMTERGKAHGGEVPHTRLHQLRGGGEVGDIHGQQNA